MQEKLTRKQRDDLLIDLFNSAYWQAIDNSFQEQMYYVWDALGTLDPFKNPTEIARMQGRLQGYSFLNSTIQGIKEERNKEEQKEVEEGEA